MVFFSTLFISLLLTVVTIPPLTKLALKLQLLDVPDERKMHSVPIPRCGGVAMAFGALTPIAYWYIDNPFVLAFLAAATCIVFFGIADDFFGLSPRWKFIGQIAAALLVILWGDVKIVSLGALLPEGMMLPDYLSVPLTLLVLVGVTNAVNLADGLDGLAGGLSLLNVCFIGYLAMVTESMIAALACLALAGAIFGFLRFNTHPATIFMGDSGSQLLGFAAVSLALLVTQNSPALSPTLPLLLFGLPVLDTLTVMVMRIRDGRSPFSPDKRHFHHRLLNLGLNHAEAVVFIYLLQSVLVICTYFLRFHTGWTILAVYLVFSLSLLTFFQVAQSAQWGQSRWSILDRIKNWFKSLKGQRRMLAFAYPCFTYIFYCLVFLVSQLPEQVSHNVAMLILFLGPMILLVQRYRSGLLGKFIRIIFFLIIPATIYYGDARLFSLFGERGDSILNFSLILLFLISILISSSSTRKKGIWSTPLDFLIMIIMAILPHLAGLSLHDQRLGLIALKSIILIISFEVLLAEQRGEYRLIAWIMAGSALLSSARFFINI